MALLPTLDLIIAEQDKTGARLSEQEIARLIASNNDEEKVGGFLYQACELLRSGNPQAALESLTSVRKTIGFTPLPVIANIIWLCKELDTQQTAAYECLSFAVDTCEMGYDNIALEAASAALMLDTLGTFEIIRSPDMTLKTVLLYEKIAMRHFPAFKDKNIKTDNNDRPVNVAMVIPNIVDYIVAYTQCSLHFARYADPSKFRLFIYSTENFSTRDKPLFPFGAETYITEQTGAASIREFTKRNTPVYLAPRNVDFIDASHAVVKKMESDKIDIALFQGGLASPIDWLVARFSKAPVKAAIHIGSSMMTPGLDITFFDNPSNIERENNHWLEEAGKRIHLPNGVDIENLAAQTPVDRSKFGIPDSPDQVVIGTISNVLYKRMTEKYMKAVASVMQRHKNAWFLALGSDILPDKMKFFSTMGVAERVKFGGKQSRAGAAIKAVDIYANEFPVGGNQSVMEAMVCGVPVVAIKWSDAHAESAGAYVVGPEFAIPRPDEHAYEQLLEKWVVDPQARAEAAALQQQRAIERFSAQQYVQTVLRHTSAILAEKQKSLH